MIRVEPLAPTFDLFTHHMDVKARNAIASCLDALMEATANITAHYVKIADSANPHSLSYKSEHQPFPAKAREFPYLTSYKINGSDIAFTYEERLFPQNSSSPAVSAIVLANTSPSLHVIIRRTHMTILHLLVQHRSSGNARKFLGGGLRFLWTSRNMKRSRP